MGTLKGAVNDAGSSLGFGIERLRGIEEVDGTEGSPGESFSLVLQGARRARATLEIQVVDVNDNAPQFISPPTIFTVPESSPTGSAITKLRTRDADTGISGMARFSSDSTRPPRCRHGGRRQSADEPHKFHPPHGHHPCWRRERVRAAQPTVPHGEHEPPVFLTDLSQVVQLPTGVQPGHEVIVLKAVDGDDTFVNETRIRYSMEKNDYLGVDPESGVVRLLKNPGSNTEIRVEVKAKEETVEEMETLGELQVASYPGKTNQPQTFVQLCKTNDYTARIKEGAQDFEEPLAIELLSPVDSSSLRIEGAESAAFAIDKTGGGTSVRVIVAEPSLIDYEKEKNMEFYAIDPDSDLSLPIAYSIIGDEADLFAVSDQGEVRSLAPVDRELHDKFDLVVRATDAGGKFIDCVGKVVVRDINDNTPKFEHPEYLLEIEEEKTVKQKLEASDPDIGENGQIVYSLENITQGLPIDASAGILFIGKLDRDTMDGDEVNVIMRASDRGEPPRTSTTSIKIKVKDINDNWPSFTNSRYSLVLDANISPGGVIGAVQADDADATSPNNVVHYISEDDRFRIADSGEVIYVGEGVLSKDTSVEFRVFAIDGGDPPRNSSSTVVINEHKSSMQSEHTAEIMLNETAQRSEIKWANSGMNGYTYEIMKATAEGFPVRFPYKEGYFPDKLRKATFFQDEEVMQWLEIDNNTGTIHTKKHPLPDKVKQIRLYVSMKKGKREVPVELIISVVDTSDNAPFFNKGSFKAIVSEDIRVGSRILQVKADGEPPIKYSLEIHAGPTDVLAIDGDAFIRNKEKLDFEKYRAISGRVHAFGVQGSEAVANFSLILADANDNRPVFVNGSVFTARVDESADIGTILNLPYPLALDGDFGNFSRLSYALIGDDGHFAIDRRTSRITLTSKLDFEIQRSHSLTVRCVDNDGDEPYNEVFASVTVLVRDVNDNAPVIHNSDLSHLTVSEDTPVGSTIAVIGTSDLDEGGKQAVVVAANHSLFHVTDEGKLVVAEKLDGYAGERLCSTIVAKDSGNPPLSTSLPFCVTYDELLRIKLLEEENMGIVTYKFDETFKKDWERFSLNASGSLSTTEPFDFENKPVHELKILACRRINCSSVHVFISVNDRNDNCPIFPRQDFQLSLTENDRSPQPRQIGRVPAAMDGDFHADNTKPGVRSYGLYHQLRFPRFQITAYDCHLACRDPHKSTNSSITGILTVKDVNDNFPKFSERNYYATVIQGHASPGSHLAQVSATDPDEEKEGLRYSISGSIRTPKQSYPLSESPISIDAKTGELSANEVLREPSYSFTVTVTDGGNHDDSASVVISVVTYSQQTELLFDAPFEFIVRNERNIVRRMFSTNSTARRELRNAYGLRDTIPITVKSTVALEIIILGVLLTVVGLLVLSLCLYCRQRHSYARKLRQITTQASAHDVSISRQPTQKVNPYYATDVSATTQRMMAPPPPPSPLQSTEL
ncbi:cadherin domain protein [Necator americanus]|uniref:Cadherin domain protein n=1 Tax=Necator americanus TaxID=51031 RepID=W2T2R6_NECAM|nr:cadherin domain protein [Necator americanus]ETN75849.1 cadherin domain protein [Necator americanus]